jgi:2-dehydro-3-deoxyphosphooctonate aldolase (KDO 8-P synthase)
VPCFFFPKWEYPRSRSDPQKGLARSTVMHIPKLSHTEDSNFILIAGPCAIEGEGMAFDIAGQVSEICQRLCIPYIFKGSYRKANRSKKDSFTGIGDEKALGILRDIGQRFQLPVTTDIHTDAEAALAAEYVDVLQIPAFLCRQTSLLTAAAHTGKVVNIKKGQFVSPESMRFAMEKVVEEGNPNVLLTERGTTFGYQDLVVDFRGIPTMQSFGATTILDCTHSLQQPNQSSGVTGGRPALIETIARAGIAVGVDGLFIETHPNPAVAKSDGANMLPLDRLEALLERLVAIRQAIRN